jgi:hypothetical protein
MNAYDHLPSDTPDHIMDMQFSIVMRKSLTERVKTCTEMADFSITMLKKQIMDKHPGISEGRLKFEMVKSLYSDCYSEEEMNRIKEHFIGLVTDEPNN